MILNYNLDLFSRIVSMYITFNVCHFSYLHYVVIVITQIISELLL